MKTIATALVTLCALSFSAMSFAEFEYRGIKSGMTIDEVQSIKGISKSGWTGGLKVNFKKFFGKNETPPGLRNVFFQFTPEGHGQKLWRVSLQFRKIDANQAFTQAGLIEEEAQTQVIEFLYPNATIKEQSETYKCGDYDFTCKASGNGVTGVRQSIIVMLIDEEIFSDAVAHVFNETKDRY